MQFEVRNLCKSFGDRQVLHGVGFSVDSGTALGLLGRNGAGKTTTIRIIMGVLTGSGEVLVDGKPIDRRRINFGYLPEERGLYPKKKILEQLVYFGVLRGMKPGAAKASALKWLDRLEMGEYANQRLDTLSKGNQQKIQLACTLISDPEFIILDEPFSGLDPVNAMLLKDVVAGQIAAGRIVLFSSHQMNYVEEFCEKIAILNAGRIAVEGKIRDIKRGYDRSRLIVTAQEPERLAAAVNAQLAGLALAAESCEGGVSVTLRSADDKLAFTERLARLGVDFDGVAVYEPSLNDIFVQYTGGQA